MKVFVYGTLRKGGRFHSLLRDSEFIGTANAMPFQLYDLGGDVPGMVAAETPSVVKGEIYEVDGTTLHLLQRLETGYEQCLVRVALLDTPETEWFKVGAFVWPDKDVPYVGTEKPALVPSGDWMKK